MDNFLCQIDGFASISTQTHRGHLAGTDADYLRENSDVLCI